MIIEPIVFYDLVIVTFVLGIGLAAVIIFYARTLKKLHETQREEEKLRSNIHKKAEEALDDARQKAAQIITEANLKAKDLLSKTQGFNDKSRNILQKQLETVSKTQAANLEKASIDLLKDYQKMLEDLKQDHVNVFRNMSKDIESYTSSELSDFKETIEKETVDTQKIVGQRIEEEFKKAETDLAAYKAEKIKKIDDSIYDLLRTVSELSFGKALSLNEHQELILQSLEQAKKQIK